MNTPLKGNRESSDSDFLDLLIRNIPVKVETSEEQGESDLDIRQLVDSQQGIGCKQK